MLHPRPPALCSAMSWELAGKQGGSKGEGKKGEKLCTSSMEEEAVTVPWALILSLYLSAIWKPVSLALQLQHIYTGWI